MPMFARGRTVLFLRQIGRFWAMAYPLEESKLCILNNDFFIKICLKYLEINFKKSENAYFTQV